MFNKNEQQFAERKFDKGELKMNKNGIKTIKTINYQTRTYAIEKDPVKIFGKNFRLRIFYKNLKISELNLDGKDIQVFLPSKYKKIGSVKILNLALDKMYESIARDEIERVMEKTRIMLGFAPEDYEIKKMHGVLAKCSDDKKITINPEIVKYDRNVIEFIVLHEFCHIKYKTHCRKFYDLLEKYMPNYRFYARKIDNLKY